MTDRNAGKAWRTNTLPTSLPANVNSFLDRCVDRMGASPEYAFALAHPEGNVQALIKAQMQIAAPIAPVGKTLADYQADGAFNAGAISLAQLYLSQYHQLMANGTSEAAATATAVTDVKESARLL
jgi:hypothetical protein